MSLLHGIAFAVWRTWVFFCCCSFLGYTYITPLRVILRCLSFAKCKMRGRFGVRAVWPTLSIVNRAAKQSSVYCYFIYIIAGPSERLSMPLNMLFFTLLHHLQQQRRNTFSIRERYIRMHTFRPSSRFTLRYTSKYTILTFARSCDEWFRYNFLFVLY